MSLAVCLAITGVLGIVSSLLSFDSINAQISDVIVNNTVTSEGTNSENQNTNDKDEFMFEYGESRNDDKRQSSK
jgi:hypothetical protein